MGWSYLSEIYVAWKYVLIMHFFEENFMLNNVLTELHPKNVFLKTKILEHAFPLGECNGFPWCDFELMHTNQEFNSLPYTRKYNHRKPISWHILRSEKKLQAKLTTSQFQLYLIC